MGKFKLNKEGNLEQNESEEKNRDWPNIKSDLKPLIQEQIEKEEELEDKNEPVSSRIVKNVIFRADPSLDSFVGKGEELLDNVFQNAVDSLEEAARRILYRVFFLALILWGLSFLSRSDIQAIYQYLSSF